MRVEEVAQPRAPQLDGENQRFAGRQRCAQPQHTVGERDVLRHGVGRKGILVVVARRIEEVVGEPGLVRDPADEEHQGHQPPVDEDTDWREQQQGRQQDEVFLPAMTPQQLLFQ